LPAQEAGRRIPCLKYRQQKRADRFLGLELHFIDLFFDSKKGLGSW
jgi:hypothetical protein